ncbi:hypothetical protein A5699_12130 [Mycobacterium sp. E802]|uniref:hypothetical protein n=1 Tax=Mycobacterium sp. E802 TaxID=1834152 RepID=UPI0007FE42A0|nr:hypothetical protein [Mycobacterium sp. E802]OBG79954.1 hypothetical protein A5699_12130 [Mycobacterium sp. E802]
MNHEQIRDEALNRWIRSGGDEQSLWADPQLRQGPALAEITARISATPAEFLDPAVDILALLDQLVCHPGGGPLVPGRNRPTDAPRLDDLGDDVRAGAAIAAWLLGSQLTLGRYSVDIGVAHRFLLVSDLAAEMLGLRVAPVAPPRTWFTDDERREEAARWFLLRFGFVPAGEDRDAARAALDMRDSLRRDRAFAAAREAYEHRAAVVSALRAKAAREAAQRYGHE